MQKLTWIMAWLIGLPALAQAEDKEAMAVLEKAIRAAGGEGRMRTFKAPMMWMTRGKLFSSGKEVPFIAQHSAKWPNWYRQETENVFTTTVSGDQAWISTPKGTAPSGRAVTKELLKQARARWAERLFPLKEKAYTLTKINGIKVNGRETEGIKATHRAGGELKLYFDKKSAMLVKMESMVNSPGGAQTAQVGEIYYSNHRHFSGVKLPAKMKMYIGKVQIMEAETVDYKVRATLDPKLFEPPK